MTLHVVSRKPRKRQAVRCIALIAATRGRPCGASRGEEESEGPPQLENKGPHMERFAGGWRHSEALISLTGLEVESASLGAFYFDETLVELLRLFIQDGWMIIVRMHRERSVLLLDASQPVEMGPDIF